MKISTILYKASEILDRDGWCRIKYEDGLGRHCMLGAVIIVCKTNYHKSEFVNQFVTGLINKFESPVFGMVYLNDKLCESGAHAATFLSMCGAVAESEGL